MQSTVGPSLYLKNPEPPKGMSHLLNIYEMVVAACAATCAVWEQRGGKTNSSTRHTIAAWFGSTWLVTYISFQKHLVTCFNLLQQCWRVAQFHPSAAAAWVKKGFPPNQSKLSSMGDSLEPSGTSLEHVGTPKPKKYCSKPPPKKPLK